jgi:hypothetical protein
MDWKVEVVHWFDPCSQDEWTDVKDLNLKPAEIVSIGHVIKETDRALIMSLSLHASEDSVSCTMIIPKVCITKRRKINVGTRKAKRR